MLTSKQIEDSDKFSEDYPRPDCRNERGKSVRIKFVRWRHNETGQIIERPEAMGSPGWGLWHEVAAKRPTDDQIIAAIRRRLSAWAAGVADPNEVLNDICRLTSTDDENARDALSESRTGE